MKRNRIIFVMVTALMFLLLGCTIPIGESEPDKQYLCSDGETIVSDLSKCPKVDVELEECKDASSSASYGASDSDICYYELALDRENVSLCRKIRNTDSWYSYTSAECGAEIALYRGDAKLCDELTFLSKYDCYLKVATQLEDSSICAEISSKGKMDDCYVSLASTLYDPTICGQISSESKTDDCLYDYISWNSYYIDDWSLCDMFSSSAGYKQSYCYYSAGEATGDLKYCDKITDSSGGYYSYTKPECYGVAASYKRNSALCDKLGSTSDKDDCYYTYATTYPYNADACDKIVDAYIKDDCQYYTNDSYYYW
jgi:hypothetical protein